MRAQEFNNIKSAKQILAYIKSMHRADEWTPHADKMVLGYPRYELKTVPLSKLVIPDENYSGGDPYDRAIMPDIDYANEIDPQDIKNRPIVVDPKGHILDGNHRALKAKKLKMTTIPAWVATT